MKISTIVVFIVLLLSSCTIQKRVHMQGYLVEWNKSVSNKKTSFKSEDITTKAMLKNEKIKLNDEHNQKESNQILKPGLLKTNESEPYKNIDLENDKIVLSQSKNRIDNKVKINKGEISSIKSNKDEIKRFKNDKESLKEEGKSQIVAFFLVFFVGVLGIHRFYLGYPGIGLLMFFTAGLCGVLALVDLIRIITGDLKPNGGEYTETF